MQVNWNDVKEDYKRKDDEIEALKQQLAELKASMPKVRADAVREAIKSLEHDCNGWAKDDQGRVYWHDKQILRVADELEAGNE